MNSSRSSRRADAFTLLELLLVIAIIGILAALIMTAANQAKNRALRIECESQLHQMGIAFQLFSHDHDGRFPMAVPLSEDGSEEFVQSGFAVGGEFYFSYRHFQALANELVHPKMLICPADTRPPAASFAALQNSNVSYFIGVKAEFIKPNSILAGDRNLQAASSLNPSILQGNAGNRLSWTSEMHRFKGNVLFADGRVEEWNNATLAAGAGGDLAGADLFIPSLIPDASHPVSRFARDGIAPTPPTTNQAPARSENNPPTIQGTAGKSRSQPAFTAPARPQNEPVVTMTNPPSINQFSTDAPDTETTDLEGTESGMSAFDQNVVRILRSIIFGTYLLVLLLFLLWLVFLWRQNSKRRRELREDGL